MFKRFLCSGMKQTVRQENGISQSLGSYHQCYRLDGRLVAFGVLDLLPSSVSSVYLVYHEDFVDWNFGKISALRELEMALQGGYQYYYMDPETYTWDVLDSEILQRMSVRKYVAMSRERLFNLPATSNVSISNQASIGELAQRFNLDLESSNSLSEYLKSPVQSSTTVEPEISFESVFEAGMPGVMTLDQVRQEVDLGQWKMKYGNIHCKLEDLVAWEEGEISDTSTIKGIVAELAASIGPDLVQQTMLEFQK
ncbi:Arginyl-tRNA--protein transferase 1 [Sticta canariensis]|nr:Arginyl-tRNA--protein transferase 1 [Sticta canariensis]